MQHIDLSPLEATQTFQRSSTSPDGAVLSPTKQPVNDTRPEVPCCCPGCFSFDY